MAKLAAAFRETAPSMAAVLASFVLTYALCTRAGANPSPAVLAAALCIGLSRRAERPTLRAAAFRLLLLPPIALAAALVGSAFLRSPLLGAILFTSLVGLSIFLRRFGDRAAALGRIAALPMLMMLAVPVPIDRSGTIAMPLLVLAAGAIAMLCATAASFADAPEPTHHRPRQRQQRSNNALSVPARMALQTIVALGLAFAIGLLVVPAHWPWIVLSAFIVCSGAIGRGDAIYKALLRTGGALAGTLAAALVSPIVIPNPPAYAALIFAVLFVGMWLRRINYAFWAACATLLFALLQGTHGEQTAPLFAARIGCIFAGALCGVVAACFVFPIRTEHVVRRRVGAALTAMRGVLAGEPHDLERHAAELERVAPPVRLHRAVFGAPDPHRHPAVWIEAAHAILARMHTPDFDRRQAGADVRSLAEMLRPAGETKQQ